jgi:acetyl-CoA carboxylase biotin carboxyl carrier protein
MTWVKRVEAVLEALKGSSIGEIELAEGEVEIILRRNPGVSMVVHSQYPDAPLGVQSTQMTHVNQRAIDVKAPLTGVYYALPSPTADPFVQIGDSVQIGQTIALIEAMKVFNEIQAEVAGRVVALKAQNGDVVKKDETLFLIESF